LLFIDISLKVIKININLLIVATIIFIILVNFSESAINRASSESIIYLMENREEVYPCVHMHFYMLESLLETVIYNKWSSNP
jgi:hypothetical protein